MLNQTYDKVLGIFGENTKKNVLVVITHKNSVKNEEDDYMIKERIEACENLGIHYILWESKDITDEERLV